jgi:hypothetical protein
MPASINDVLPPELIVLFLSFLDRFDGSLAQQVCRLWCTLLRDESTRLPRQLKTNTETMWIRIHHRITWAASCGYLDIVKWAREQGCQWIKPTSLWAACGGHLAVLRWLRENGCPLDPRTCAYAAGGGHLAVLRWAREHGCPWDEETCAEAASGGHFDVLHWLNEQDCPCGREEHLLW